MRTETIAIVGAGLAGLACARRLVDAGLAVRLFDKGRSAGGRLATRRAMAGEAALQFDHGAQYLTARGPDFAAALAAAGAADWTTADRFVGVPGMSALPRRMAEGLAVAAGRHVGSIRGGPGEWLIEHWPAALVRPGQPLPAEAPAEDGPFAAVAIAVPAPQAVPLVAAHVPAWAARLAHVVLAPCWTVLASFSERLPLPDSLRPEGGPIGWAARDSSKPGRDPASECWVIQASPAWSRARLEDAPEDVIAPLLAALAGGLPAPRFAAAHRWRFSLVETPLGQSCLWDAESRLGLAGDWCLAGRAEAAFDSGRALAEAMLAASGDESG